MNSGAGIFKEIGIEFRRAMDEAWSPKDVELQRGWGTGLVSFFTAVPKTYLMPVIVPAKVIARRLGLGS